MKFNFFKNNKGPARIFTRILSKGGCFKGACPTKSFRRGFALLFSVLVSSLLLTIGLSIFNIALKELAISTATQRSIHAFYAADSGYECVKYWDSYSAKIPTVVLPGLVERGITNIRCGSADSSSIDKNPVDQVPDENVTSTYTFSGDLNTKIEIKKEKNDIASLKCSAGQAICTTITSRGWDSDSGDKVERGIEIKY